MILAAGRGERMRPLTDTCPKPLLTVNGMPLIEYHLNKLAAAGITDIIINHAWLGEQIENYLGDGRQFSLNICYSAEKNEALETAGGIIKALPLLGEHPFLIINADVFTDFSFTELPTLKDDHLAHLWLVNNPSHNPNGDFLMTNGLLQNLLTNSAESLGQQSYTYSGIAMFRPEFFQNFAVSGEQKTTHDEEGACYLEKVLPLAPMLRCAADLKKVSASVYSGHWTDVGTPERLQQLNN